MTEADARHYGAKLVPLELLMSNCDVISLHAPLLPSTRGMITRAHLESLRTGSTLINTARGALVDEGALIDRLHRGDISAVLDVTDPEPPLANSPLWTLPNVFLTPHIAGATGRDVRRLGTAAVEEVERFTRDRSLGNEVVESDFALRA